MGLCSLATLGAAQESGVMPEPGAPTQVQTDSGLPAGSVSAGERLSAEALGESVIETWDQIVARQAALGFENGPNPKARNGSQGEWQVPSMRFAQGAHSGTKHLMNSWGDTNLGLGFGRSVDLDGAWIAAQGTLGSWTSGLSVVGFKNGVEVARTAWFEDINPTPGYFSMQLKGVDAVEFHARAAIEGGGWFALDDLTFQVTEDGVSKKIVLDFEDLEFHAKLTGTNYAGLTWPQGTGNFAQAGIQIVPRPQVPPGQELAPPATSGSQSATLGGGGTAPTLLSNFIGGQFGDTGANLIPPDTCGAIGPNHFVSATNRSLGIFNRTTGAKISAVSLNTFWATSGLGDPRVGYDQHNGRWVLNASNFSNRIYLAYSLTSDPTGTWFKSNVLVSQGTDAGRWPDYQTLGFDANGIYFAAYMVGTPATMSIFAVDKAPLLNATPALGTVTAWRSLPWEGAIQPCATYGYSGGVFLVSRQASTQIRVRQITGPLTAPTLVEKGPAAVLAHSSGPDAPQQGTVATLDTIDYRPMNAVYRNGSIYTTQCVNIGGRAAVRWYQIGTSPVSTLQTGSIDDPVKHYYMPSISVNAANEVLLGFSGSSGSQFVGAYIAGRKPTDPLGQVCLPIQYKAGEAVYTQISSSGVNRFGDYSLTSVDPLDDTTFWTIQQYARLSNTWVTRVGSAKYDNTPCATPTAYCTAKLSSSGCLAQVGHNGSPPSLSGAAAFQIATSGMESNVNGLSFFGTTGQNNAPFNGGTLCVLGTLHRLSVKNSAGGSACTGAFSYSLADLAAQASGGALVVVGATIDIQTWYRDPSDPFTVGLSGGLEFQVCP